MTMVADQERNRELPEPRSGEAKTEVVLRLLRGEAVDQVALGRSMAEVGGAG